MTLYFNTAELTDGTRRDLLHVKSAMLRLHLTGHVPPRRSKQTSLDFLPYDIIIAIQSPVLRMRGDLLQVQ